MKPGSGPLGGRFLAQFAETMTRTVAAAVILPSIFLFGGPRPASMSTAYGTLNNFDCVNDTGYEAHGFDIEIEGCRSSDITYTYDWNHYGVPKISEDLSNPAIPRVLVRYASSKKPDGSWAAYTAIPSGPISPTDGHQFTNPSINFGGEHYGVGYYGLPSAVKYYWLIDDGAGNLVRGAPVFIATPTFNYNPPAAGAPANVVAVIALPPPPAPPVYQFGDAMWVKSIKTTTHNANKVRLQDLVSDDPGNPEPWANGEPDEVEVEWRLMQTEFAAPNGGPNGELEGAPEDLPDGDEVITRRYEFYKYTGPFDGESNEAMADAIGPDDLHGVGMVTYNDYFDLDLGEWVTATVDLSTIEVIGEFVGAQMSGFDVAPATGLIDNIQDGELNVPFPDRTVVVSGGWLFIATLKSGALPPGMAFNQFSGVLSGTPTQVGVFSFTIEVNDTNNTLISKDYTMTVAGDAAPETYVVSTAVSPLGAGTATGGGTFNIGDSVTLEAIANPGYYFLEWAENFIHFSFTPTYTFTASANRDLVAKFGVDGDRPITSASLSGTAGTNGWYLGPVEVTLNATDPLSGVKSTSYQVDGGASQPYTAPFSVSSAGTHTVTFWSEDNAGNVEVEKVRAINIDLSKPSTDVALSGTSGANGWFLGPVEVTLSVSDDLSGVKATSYRTDGGATQNYAGPFMLSTPGAHIVSYWSEDDAGNTETAKTQAVSIDAVAPNISATASKTQLLPANGKMVNVVISGTITDGDSGVNVTTGSFQTVDSYGLIQPTGTYVIGANGAFSFTVSLEARKLRKDPLARTYTITLHVADLAGNVGSQTVVVSVPNRK